MSEDDEICHVVRIGGTGMEWVCVRPPHNPGYVRKNGDATHRKGEVVRGTGGHLDGPDRGFSAPAADRHYFQRRWPNRDQ